MLDQPPLLANILIVFGESFWVLSIGAQLIKLYRTGNTQGLAPISQTLNTAGNVGWATYFAINNLWFPFATNVIVFLLGAATLGYTLSNRKKFATGLAAILIIGPITSYVLITHPEAGGWIGMSYNWLAGTPWLVKIIRKKKVSGISERGIYFAFAAMLCVLSYGFIINSLPLIVGSIQGLVYESIVIRYYYHYRHRK